MSTVTNLISLAWEVLRGKKAYIAGACAIAYGLIQNEPEMLIAGLGLIGVRHGISNELSKLIQELEKTEEALGK